MRDFKLSRLPLLLLAALLSWAAIARAETDAKATAKVTDAGATAGPLSLNFKENDQVLLDVASRKSAPLNIGPNDRSIAQKTVMFLEQAHYLQRPFDDTVSSRFLDRYLEVLDGAHIYFFQTDLQDFEQYRTKLDDLIKSNGDVSPAHVIFSRFLQRVDQRVAYMAEELRSEKFDFAGNDSYAYNRKDAPRPKNLEEAKVIWRQHLRFEILQEKLNKEKPEEIAKKISRRYARFLRSWKDFDSDDILEVFLSALTHVYDPHSDYMGKSSYDSFSINMKLSLFGIGALLQSEDGYCKIKSLVPGGPAEKSQKIKENDRIIAVAQGTNDPVDVVDMKLNKVVEMIRGAKGTEVRLTVIPADADMSTRKVIPIVRDEIKLEEQEAKAKIIEMPTEKGRALKLGIIDLPSFYADFDTKKAEGDRKSTTADVEKLLGRLNREKVDGIILDLRRNGGGSLEEAINLTGLFIKEGPVVQVQDASGKIDVDADTDPTISYDGPLIVLTSRFSASASEILAGALQDYGRALIVGDSATHGKGTVQTLMNLKPYIRSMARSDANPGALKLTIRKFYRANGSSTQLNGVTPDLVLPSLNNYAEVGESSLDNPLPFDTIASAQYEKLNRIQPVLPELKKRSEQRVTADRDFAYLREDIEIFKKRIAEKRESLNEGQRLREKKEQEDRDKARKEEIKARPQPKEIEYDITLKHLNDPLKPVTAESRKKDEKKHAVDLTADDEEESKDTGPKFNPGEVGMKEARRVLVDLIGLLNHDPSITASAWQALK